MLRDPPPAVSGPGHPCLALLRSASMATGGHLLNATSFLLG